MNKKYLTIILSFSFFLVLLAQGADARTMEQITSTVFPFDTFKIFDDGVEYTKDCLSRGHGELTGYNCAIIHEGVEYPCEFKRMHGGMISPMCIEIILKTMENNN